LRLLLFARLLSVSVAATDDDDCYKDVFGLLWLGVVHHKQHYVPATSLENYLPMTFTGQAIIHVEIKLLYSSHFLFPHAFSLVRFIHINIILLRKRQYDRKYKNKNLPRYYFTTKWMLKAQQTSV
jgi:hypothetical protein